MQSDFEMATGVITLPNLAFDVPGADILLKGTYTLSGGGLDFKGLAKMQATVSKMVGGWKGFLLKPADRFFKKDGAGTEVPIHVGRHLQESRLRHRPQRHAAHPSATPRPAAVATNSRFGCDARSVSCRAPFRIATSLKRALHMQPIRARPTFHRHPVQFAVTL